MGGLSASGTALGNGGHARRRSQPSSIIGSFSFTVAGFCLSLKPVVIEHRRSRNVALMDPWEGTPPTPTSKPLLGVHNLSSTSYELDGVSGTYGPSYVGRRVSRQQINRLPPTPRGATNWSRHSHVQLQKYHSGSISRALHCLENSMTLACVRRASFGAKRGATSRKLRPPGGRGFFLVGGPSRTLISRSPAISANRCGGFPVATHQFRLCS
jgi:hypothetical protein